MKRNLSAIKNIGWALGILLCLLALFVALVVAAILPGPEELDRGGVDLNNLDLRPANQSSQTVEEEPLGDLLVLGESADAGQGYIDGLTFLVDSSAIGLRDYALLSGGTGTSQVWGSSAGNIPAGDLLNCRIRFPEDGTEISPIEAASRTQPSRLVIILGSDGLDDVDEERFVQGYVDLIKGIRLASPNTVIIVCSVSSVGTSYSGVDGVNANTIRTVNTWIQTVCRRTGAYYCDSASAVNDRAGWLDVSYAAVNGKSLNSAGLQRILEYLRSHAI